MYALSELRIYYPILNKLVIPCFIGKDARYLESQLFGLYRYNSQKKGKT